MFFFGFIFFLIFKNDSFFKKLSRFDTFKSLKIKLSIYTRQRTINGFIKKYFYTTKTKIQWYQNFCSTCINRAFDFCQHCILNQMQFKSIKMSSGINDFVRICYVKDNIVSH